MLRSLDLFTGIGGITYGLRDIAIPVGYCERDDFCVDVLKTLMTTRHIPVAPIYPDIRTLTAEDVRDVVDIIVGGSPCVGFSSAGKRRGLDDEQSKLYVDMMRVVADINPSHVFLENVAAIAQSGGALDRVVGDLETLGYECVWTTLRAYDVGAPQLRKRWFLLASRPGVPPTPVHAQRKPTVDWTTEPCPRMARIEKTTRKKFKALGNAAVPDQVRAAYAWLSSAFRHGLRGTYPFPSRPRSGNTITLLPGVVTPPKHPKNSLPEVVGNVSCAVWGTPRSSFVNANRVLTSRGAKDLPTQLRFERNTPHDLRTLHPNPDWIAWLQGFPAGWM